METMRSTEPVPLDKSKLKQARLTAGLTGSDTALLAGIQRQNYYAIEAGRRPVAFDTYLALVDALGVDPGDLAPTAAAGTLQALRLQRRITRVALADEIGVSYHLIYAVEHGRRNLTDRLSAQLSAALGVSQDEIGQRVSRQVRLVVGETSTA